MLAPLGRRLVLNAVQLHTDTWGKTKQTTTKTAEQLDSNIEGNCTHVTTSVRKPMANEVWTISMEFTSFIHLAFKSNVLYTLRLNSIGVSHLLSNQAGVPMAG